MAEKEQVKPLAPTVASPIHSDQENNAVVDNPRRRKNFVKCCGCVSAITIIVAVVMIILAFTVFHVRGPIVKMNSITTVGVDNNNLTLVADVSVKNPNSAAFRYDSATTTVFYGGAAVGEGEIPAGVARARRTVRTNLTVEVSMERILNSPSLTEDLVSGSVTMESFTRLEGRVKIANIVKRRVVVKLNCTMVYGIFSQNIQKQDCEHDLSL